MKLLLLFLLTTACTASISGQGIVYENRNNIPKADMCKSSEVYIKKKVKAQLASYYTDYPLISVDFSSFKGQNGYDDKETPGKIVYPFKIEMLVYLKRKIVKEGKELTELCTWKYDSIYEYATMKGKKCEFRIVPSSQKTLINRQEY